MSETTVAVMDRDIETLELADMPVPSPGKSPLRESSVKNRLKQSREIRWSGVNYSVKDKHILTDCWGDVGAGQVCAIMGPSGAGKSSLLNVLSGRSSSAAGITVEGKITVGGKDIDPVAFRRNIAYVMQDDALMATATPREALRFSAHLRLPSSTSAEEIDGIVDNLLGSLGLSGCADVLIGGALIKGISGGQRKRTSVGVEIITDPSLLFLDEPTSGLDSYSAFSLIKLLKEVAATNCAVLCTIHQPSSEVFFLFDIVIYMKDGRIFYQGAPNDILPFYASKGCVCPDDYNPSDFVMNLCQAEGVDDLQAKGLFIQTPDGFLAHSPSSRKYGSSMVEFTAESSFIKQVMAISYREIVNAYRDTPALMARFGITIVLNLIFGLIFLGACGKDNGDQDNFNTHVGAIAMVIIFGLFGSGQSIMLSFPFERPMILREYATGTYSVVAYFVSKLVVEAPMTFMQFIVQYLLVYFMMDMQGDFILMVLATFGLGMASNSVAMAMGCAVPDVKDVTELAPLMYVPQILFAGFFIRTDQIPVFLRWAQYLCSMKYGMNLVLMSEFRLDRDNCQGADAEKNCREIMESNSIDASVFYIYIILLFVLFLVGRLLGAGILIQKAKRFY